jgi:hypothetical protein
MNQIKGKQEYMVQNDSFFLMSYLTAEAAGLRTMYRFSRTKIIKYEDMWIGSGYMDCEYQPG